MEQLQTKRGKIETIGEKKITILNLDGLCRDTFEVTPGEASYIRDKFGLDVEILYSVKGNRLVHMWPDEEVPELRGLYEAFPKVTECTAPIEGGEARWDGVFSL
jgi:hypothetical protein